jgi:hypothetical protein
MTTAWSAYGDNVIDLPVVHRRRLVDWTPEEDRTLIELLKYNHTSVEMAVAVGRTVTEVYARLRELRNR